MSEPLPGDLQHHLSCPLCGSLLSSTRTDWTCAKGHTGPVMTLVSVHRPTCKEALMLVAQGMGRQHPTLDVSPYALPHPACMADGLAGEYVIVTEQMVAPHAFRPGKMSKGSQRLCADCRNPKRGHPL